MGWGRYLWLLCKTYYTYLTSKRTPQIYMVPIFCCYPSSTILLSTKAICSRHIHRLVTISVKVHLTPQFFPLKRIYFSFEILLRKNFWMRINPWSSVPRRNLENSSKTAPFLLHDRVWREWVQQLLWCLPRKIDYLPPLIFLRRMQYRFKQYAEMPSRGALGCCSNTPQVQKLRFPGCQCD